MCIKICCFKHQCFLFPTFFLAMAWGFCHVQVNPGAHPMKALRAQTNQTESSGQVACRRLEVWGIHWTGNIYNTVCNVVSILNNVREWCVMECKFLFTLLSHGCYLCFSSVRALLGAPEIHSDFTEGQPNGRKEDLWDLRVWEREGERERAERYGQSKGRMNEMGDGWWQAKKGKREKPKRHIYTPSGLESISDKWHSAYAKVTACLGLHDNPLGQVWEAVRLGLWDQK